MNVADVKEFSYDIKIADGYKKFAQELLRLSLLALTGCAVMWLKLKMPDPGQALKVQWIWLELAFFSFLMAAGFAAAHLYVSNDALAEELIRRRKPDETNVGARNRMLRFSATVLINSAVLLIVGVVFFLVGVIQIKPLEHTEKNKTWQFAVAGDSRNCGDVVMPEIARSVKEHGAKFYWHLGDFRWISKIDEDMELRTTNPVTDLNQYKDAAWNDFVENQVVPFGEVPVYLGIGNHEAYYTADRAVFVRRFSSWMPENATAPYFHWTQDGIDFIYLDNATNDQFDRIQMDWLSTLLETDLKNESVKAIVVGMHAALPKSVSNKHAMDDWEKGRTSGQEVYERLVKFNERKKVYLLASHSHYYSPNAYDTPDLQGKVLPGWIIGTAGAQRNSLSATQSVYSDYGYLLATVDPPGEPEGTVKFAFKAIGRPADAKKLGERLIDFCFEKNRRAVEPSPGKSEAR